MKALLLSAIIMSGIVTGSAEARSILVFKTVTKCTVVDKISNLDLLIQKAQDGQTQIVLKPEGEADIKIQVIQIDAQGRVGAPTTFVGEDASGKLSLTIGQRPYKVGKVVGRAARLTVEPIFYNLDMFCSAVK